MTIAQELAEKYSLVVQEYFAMMSESEAVQSSETQSYILRLGLNTITHIYKLAFNSSKHIATTVNHTQKGMFFFIEYVEQTNKMGVLSSIDYMDAVAFVYDKSLSDLCVGNCTSSSSIYTNMLSASYPQFSDEDICRIRTLFSRMTTLCSVLFWFSNNQFNVADYCDIARYLDDIVMLVSTEELADIVCLFLDTAQEKIANISKAQYLEILVCITKHLKRITKRNEPITFPGVRDICLHLGVHYSGMTIEQIAVEEGWKKPVEDLVRLVFRA